MEHSNRIKALSRKLRYVLFSCLVLVPVATVLYWTFFNHFPPSLKAHLPVTVEGDLSLGIRFLALFVSAIPMTIKVAGLLILIKLFRLYEQGFIFTSSNVACFRKLGKILIVWFISVPIHAALLSIALTFQNQPGKRAIAISLGEADITALMVGVMLIVISWVMDEGRKLEDEQAYTI